MIKNLDLNSALLLLFVASLSGCGSDNNSPPVPHPLNGTVSGLINGNSITLANNGGDLKTTSSNGNFSFDTTVMHGDNYLVTIDTQPADLFCVVENGSGVVDAQTRVVITCPVANKNSLLWMRCTHGQQWNASTGDCTGTGNSGNHYGALAIQYCSSGDNNCNGGSNTGTLTSPTGGATSSLYAACHDLNANSGGYGNTSWRVPTAAELKGLVVCSNGPATPLADFTSCDPGYVSPTLDSLLFPNSLVDTYLSASSYSSAYAYGQSFNNGFMNNDTKQYVDAYYARCVATP